jgi:subtilisin-like proprotein convertase family protein
VLTGASTDDIYVQQVATVPQSLLYADNSSFIDEPGVVGDYGKIEGIEGYASIYVTNAERRTDVGVTSNNYPVFDFTNNAHQVKTRFVSQHDSWVFGSDVTGVLRYQQSDGSESRWRITGTRDALSFAALAGGNSYGVPGGPLARAGDLFPVFASHIEPIPVRAQSAVEVTWQVAGAVQQLRTPGQPLVSPFTSDPYLDQLTYVFNDETVFGATPITEFGVRPSVPNPVINGITQPTLFTLPNAVGGGASGIVPGTLTGTLTFNGTGYRFRVESATGNRLVFEGGLDSAGDPAGLEYVLRTRGGKPKTVSGSVNFSTGVISLTFGSWQRNGLTDTFDEQSPGPVSIDAEYAVYNAGTTSQPAGSFTVFAGLDITAAVSVDLLSPGAAINVDSPLVMRESLVGADTSLRATNINIDAKLRSNDRLDIAGSAAPRGQVASQAFAVAELSGDEVSGVFLPPGLAGAGYDADSPPQVTIASPNGELNAVAGLVTVDRDPMSATVGRITGIAVVDPGFRYPSAPLITIAAPSGAGGVLATAVAMLDAQGRISGITITNGGAGYQSDFPSAAIAANPNIATATAVVDAFGRISGFAVTNGGAGYARRPIVTIAPPEAVAAAELGGVTVAGGSVTAISIVSGGYGYRSAPRVWIAPPPETAGGTQATAIATIDNEGRVTGITITDAGSGYQTIASDGTIEDFIPAVRILGPNPAAQAEVVRFNASVAANVFEVHIGDDPGTDAERGLMVVSPTGSLAREFLLGSGADSVFVQAVQADVVVEGTIWARNQSYLLQSLPEVSDLAPFLLTTTSPETGASTGTIRGGTVGITLANDAPTPADGAVAFNDVDLHTDIDSLRVRAATSGGAARSEPFPYELRVSEANSIAIEAVAASSFPVTLAAEQNLLFNASLATAGDVNLRAGSLFTLSAPVSTTMGRIGVVAQNITVENSLRVTSVDVDDTREDILLEATGGNIGIAGFVSAVNGVTLRQMNRTGPNAFDYSNRDPAVIADNATVVRSITVVDAFTFDDLDVGIDIAHTFVGDLSAVLVAPDGTRVRLFTRIGAGGDNFAGTIFDSEAATPIAAGAAPYTGRFRPQDSLVPLYGRDARGTWRLEVTDSSLGDTGSLTNFSLSFSSPQPATGRISGPARVRADHLTIDAEGIVGNPDAAPGVGSHYLRTNVNSLSGRAGESFAIDELNDIHVTDLRAGGLVSLRANGVDPAAGPNAGRAALTASLADVPAIDLNAPAGSVDVVNNAPRTIILGNAEALRRGTAVSMVAAGSVTIRSTGGATRGEIFALDAPLAGSGARTARYLAPWSSLPAGAVYAPRNPGTTASTISGTGSLAAVAGWADLRINDRVLVTAGAEANGVYAVTSLGGASRWVLTRATDSDTAAELPSNSFVRVTGGSGAGIYQLTYAATTTIPFARCPITVTAVSLATNIGSDDPTDAVTFVVSTAGGTNNAAGSLGKMMLLRQQNDTSGEASNPDQKMDFRFSGQVVTPIQLTQQLPVVTKALTIDGNTSYNPPGSPGVSRPRITIDGSRITQSRLNNPVMAGTVVNGFDVRGSAAAGTVLSNMTVTGFTKGAAVQVQDTTTVLLNSLTLGSSEFGLRVPNEYGLRVAGSTSEVTLLNSTVSASTKAGVRVEGSASNVVVVGSTIGLGERDNAIGVQFDSTGPNRLGVTPVGPLTTIPTVTATRVNATTFTLPASFRGSAALLVPGLGVTGSGIAASSSAAAVVQSVAVNASTGITTVVITGGTVTASGGVTFAHYAVTTLGGRQIALPGSVSAASLYLGQAIAGTGIVPGTRIAAIARGATTLVTLSTPMTSSGMSPITFPGPNNGAPRNVIQNNLVGVELRSGSSSVINSSITNNALDGLRIYGGVHEIGRPDRSRSGFSNVIHGNGGFGIVVDIGANSRASAVALAGQQTVRGNFLGVTSGNQAAGLNTKGNIGLRYSTSTEELYAGEAPGFKFQPLAPTFVDGEGNQHNVTATTGGGSVPRRGVPSVPPRRRR